MSTGHRKSTADWLALLGIEFMPVSHTERLVSALGGFVAIGVTFVLCSSFLDSTGSAMLVASMGASAVLLFAVPHGKLSQPWAVFGGHMASALIGVSCAGLLGQGAFAAATAVGLAIGVMYYLRCLHPPGGATALTAVIGGGQTQALGFQFVLTPVLLNVVLMLAVALLFNYAFRWRRYPAALGGPSAPAQGKTAEKHPGPISHADFVFALSELDSFVDIAEHDLLHIYALATGRSARLSLNPDQIRLGRCYSNGEFGDQWAVRQVVDESEQGGDPARDMVVYKTLAGEGRRTSGVASRQDFARWARYEVERDEQNWKQVTRAARETEKP